MHDELQETSAQFVREGRQWNSLEISEGNNIRLLFAYEKAILNEKNLGCQVVQTHRVLRASFNKKGRNAQRRKRRLSVATHRKPKQQSRQ